VCPDIRIEGTQIAGRADQHQLQRHFCPSAALASKGKREREREMGKIRNLVGMWRGGTTSPLLCSFFPNFYNFFFSQKRAPTQLSTSEQPTVCLWFCAISSLQSSLSSSVYAYFSLFLALWRDRQVESFRRHHANKARNLVETQWIIIIIIIIMAIVVHEWKKPAFCLLLLLERHPSFSVLLNTKIQQGLQFSKQSNLLIIIVI